MKKLNNVLLIDDDNSTNFANKIIIEGLGVTEMVTVFTDASKALEYLKTSTKGSYPKPDLIFLDINMPGMDGWQFLDEYDKLDDEMLGGIVLVMLSSSPRESDKHRALERGLAKYMKKPLTAERMKEIMMEHFGY